MAIRIPQLTQTTQSPKRVYSVGPGRAGGTRASSARCSKIGVSLVILPPASTTAMAISIYGLFHLGHLFRLFGQGEIFGSENVHELLIVTRSLFAYGIANPIIGAVLSVIVTMNNPPGEKQIAFGIGSDDLTIFFIATVFLIIGWVMAEGHKISEENAQIV